jgi:hypothetical protein
MLVIGIICLVLGYLLGIHVLSVIGIVLAVIGAALLVAGVAGARSRAVGIGSSHGDARARQRVVLMQGPRRRRQPSRGVVGTRREARRG